MAIPAVYCSPIKPQVSFGYDSEDKYNEVVNIADKLNDEFVNSSQIKKPVAVIASIGLAGLVAYLGGAKLSKVISKACPKAPEVFTKGVDKVGSKVSDLAKNLKGATDGKFVKAKQLTGKQLEKIGGIVKKGYDKIGGNIEDVAQKNSTVFKNALGLGAMGTVLPPLFSRDCDKNGVSDILEKGQNAYTGTKSNVSNVLEKTSQFADLIELLV